jgi:phenylpyruvate tautomerase PptA (4-oxalocrotonate tautomerase family)
MPHTQVVLAKRPDMNQKRRIAKCLIEALSQEAKIELKYIPLCLLQVESDGFTEAGELVLDRASVKTSLTLRKATELQLPARSLLRMEGDCRGVSVLCRSGLCWITQEGDSRDYLLEHKQNFSVNQDGVVVVQALADTELLVTPE